MKQPDPKIFDDIARMAGGAMNVFSGFREQISADIKARVEEMASRMDLVPREDFDRLELQVKALQKQIEALGSSEKSNPPASKKTPSKKTPSKKTPSKKTPGKK